MRKGAEKHQIRTTRAKPAGKVVLLDDVKITVGFKERPVEGVWEWEDSF